MELDFWSIQIVWGRTVREMISVCAHFNASMFWRRLFFSEFSCSITKSRLKLFQRKLVSITTAQIKWSLACRTDCYWDVEWYNNDILHICLISSLPKKCPLLSEACSVTCCTQYTQNFHSNIEYTIYSNWIEDFTSISHIALPIALRIANCKIHCYWRC